MKKLTLKNPEMLTSDAVLEIHEGICNFCGEKGKAVRGSQPNEQLVSCFGWNTKLTTTRGFLGSPTYYSALDIPYYRYKRIKCFAHICKNCIKQLNKLI